VGLVIDGVFAINRIGIIDGYIIIRLINKFENCKKKRYAATQQSFFFYNVIIMNRESLKALMEAGLELEQLRIEYYHRMVLLGIASMQGMEQRNLRLNSQCNEPKMFQYRGIPDIEGVIQFANAQSKFLSECSEACIKEARNVTQVALLTQDELVTWNDRLISGWLKLAAPLTLLCRENVGTRLVPSPDIS
jgi:hypothetical protein